jgi:hypothetical protein
MLTMVRTGPALRAPVALIDFVRVRRVEQRLIADAAHLVFASARDRDVLVPAAHGARCRTAIVPNGVDTEFWARSAPLLGDAIVFTGVMRYPPNEDAAVHLITDVLPLVRQQEPGVPCLVVGRDPTPRLLEVARRASVTVTGYVDDVRPWLERAAVFAAPLRQGAGIQNKVLEAMAMGVPVVASPLAADGVRTQSGGIPPVAVAATAVETARAIVERIRTARAGRPPDEAGRGYVVDNFSWQRSGRLINEVLRRLTVEVRTA